MEKEHIPRLRYSAIDKFYLYVNRDQTIEHDKVFSLILALHLGYERRAKTKYEMCERLHYYLRSFEIVPRLYRVNVKDTGYFKNYQYTPKRVYDEA